MAQRLKNEDLRKLLEEKGLDSTGKKEEMVKRLSLFNEQSTAAGQEGLGTAATTEVALVGAAAADQEGEGDSSESSTGTSRKEGTVEESHIPSRETIYNPMHEHKLPSRSPSKQTSHRTRTSAASSIARIRALEVEREHQQKMDLLDKRRRESLQRQEDEERQRQREEETQRFQLEREYRMAQMDLEIDKEVQLYQVKEGSRRGSQYSSEGSRGERTQNLLERPSSLKQKSVEYQVLGPPLPVPTRKPLATKNTLQSQVMETPLAATDALQTLSQALELSRLACPEPPVFKGNSLEFSQWRAAFMSLVGNKPLSADEKLNFLQKYLDGPPKEAVEGYFMLSGQEAYTEAWKVLEERYGDNVLVADSFRKKLDEWTRIPAKDPKKLRSLADFIRQCTIAMSVCPALSILDDHREIHKLVSKLPDWLACRWVREAVRIRKSEGRSYPSFKQFSVYMQEEAKIACDPLLAPSQSVVPEAEPSKSHHRHTSPRTEAAPQEVKQLKCFACQAAHEMEKCLFCKSVHDTAECQQLGSQSVEEINQFIMDARLCYGCLKPHHRVRECQQRRSCLTCHERHPSVLHSYNVQKMRRISSVEPEPESVLSQASQ